MKNIMYKDNNHKNYELVMLQVCYNSVGTKIHTLPRCGLVTIQIDRHILSSISSWCGLVCQGVFFLTNAVLKSCRFYTSFIVHKFESAISNELKIQF